MPPTKRSQKPAAVRRTMAEWSALCMEDRPYTLAEMDLRLQYAQLETLTKIEHQLDRIQNGRMNTFEKWMVILTRSLRRMGLTFIPTYGPEIDEKDLQGSLEAAEQLRLDQVAQDLLRIQAMAPANPVMERTPR
jgi:hypothetical protein